VSSERIDAAREAHEDFERFLKTHASERGAFESMISTAAGRDRSRLHLPYKRAAFRANSHLYGLQVRTRVGCTFFHPGSEPGACDIVIVRGHLGLRCLRPHAAVRISSTIIAEGVRAGKSMHDLAGIDDESPIIREFCSEPLPELTQRRTASGHMVTELTGLGIGNTSAIDCVICEVRRNVWSPHEDVSPRSYNGSTTQYPTEVLVHDMALASNVFELVKPEVVVYGAPDPSVNPLDRSERTILPLGETVGYLGRGVAVTHTLDAPRYAELLQYVCARLGWNPEVFDLYRCRVEYPVLHATVNVEFDLPKSLRGLQTIPQGGMPPA
jgi:hypothetical protein